ncbi:MAG TPA: hypothetical protein VMG12_36025 [Polyangiaceae bacterium]|nr:hypothetical protein [Polyangiaceae bacterium]
MKDLLARQRAATTTRPRTGVMLSTNGLLGHVVSDMQATIARRRQFACSLRHHHDPALVSSPEVLVSFRGATLAHALPFYCTTPAFALASRSEAVLRRTLDFETSVAQMSL